MIHHELAITYIDCQEGDGAKKEGDGAKKVTGVKKAPSERA